MASTLDTNVNDNVSVPDLIKRIRLIGGQGGDPSSQGSTQPPVSSPDNNVSNVPTPIASAVQPTGPSDANLLKAPLASQYGKDQEQRQVENDTVAPPSEIAQAAIAPKVTPPVPSVLQGAVSEPEPGKGFNKFQAALAKIRPFLPVAAAIGGGLEAAGSPNHEAPNAARLLQAEQNAAQRRIEQEKVGIEQQQANTEEKYKEALGKQYGLQIAGYDANGNPIYAQPKDFGKVGSTEIGSQGRVEVAHINQGQAIPVDPTVAQLIGMPEMANVPVGKGTWANIDKALNARGLQRTDLGTDGYWVTDRAGNKIAKMSNGSPSIGRATAYARARSENTPVNVEIINPETGLPEIKAISQAKQLQTGVPSVNTALSVGKATNNIYAPALDADTRLKQMYEQVTDKTGASDQALLFNHIAMTGGNVKGLRMGQYLTDAHRQARGISEEMGVLWNHLASGQSLSPQQRLNFVRLAEQVRASRWDQARREAATLGVSGEEPSPDPDLPPIQNNQNSAPSVRTPNKANPRTTGGTKTFDVTDPRGVVHHFPTQAAANNFRKLANIQ